jgi:hypothetical protein
MDKIKKRDFEFEKKVQDNYLKLKDEMYASGRDDIYFILHHIADIQAILQNMEEKISK